MKANNLIWYSADREDVSGIAFGSGAARGTGNFSPPVLIGGEPPLCVAFPRDSISALDYVPPALFMLHSSSAAETLSWLRVFSREAFPLSQFARVITDRDWEEIYSGSGEGVSVRTDKWASVILGEILAQGESDADLDGIPLSRAIACYSSAIAKANFIHDSFPVIRACTERLRMISDDSRFSKRVITVDELVPVWAILSANMTDTSDLFELTELLLHAIEKVEGDPKAIKIVREVFKGSSKIFGDSVEERVVAFQVMAAEIVASAGASKYLNAPVAVALALGAFLVGRGTSHAFLLRKYPSLAPSAFVWFGLIAALRGAKGWDPAWARMAKGIERQLRVSFNWQDPPAADICWTEYIWLSQQFKGDQAFSSVARSTARTLAIEVVPGAVCQLRVSSEGRVSTSDSRRVAVTFNEEVRVILEQLNILSSKARHVLGAHDQKAPVQSKLIPDEKNEILQPKPKSKRTYKRTGK